MAVTVFPNPRRAEANNTESKKLKGLISAKFKLVIGIIEECNQVAH